MTTTKLTPQERVREIIDLLKIAGYVDDGETRSEVVRIPTSKSPLYGKSGGELATLGGRKRMHLPNTDRYVTVGPRTVNFYQRPEHGDAYEFRQAKNVDGVAEILNKLRSA